MEVKIKLNEVQATLLEAIAKKDKETAGQTYKDLETYITEDVINKYIKITTRNLEECKLLSDTIGNMLD